MISLIATLGPTSWTRTFRSIVMTTPTAASRSISSTQLYGQASSSTSTTSSPSPPWNNLVVLTAKSTELFPGSIVRRAIPQVQCRSVGPFVFLDHFGPNLQSMNVGPHPHIGLCTLTYVYDGIVLHRDSTGVEQEILPNQVNWMYSGKGVTHSERPRKTVDHEDDKNRLHGLQLWVALPKDQEDMDPIFYHSPTIVPMMTVEESASNHHVQVKLVVGRALGFEQPNIPLVPGLEDLFLISVEFDEDNDDDTHANTNLGWKWDCPMSSLTLGKDTPMQVGFYVSSGKAEILVHSTTMTTTKQGEDEDEEATKTVLDVGQCMVLTTTPPGTQQQQQSPPPPPAPKRFTIVAQQPGTKVAVLGGGVYPEPRHLLWNFCSYSPEKLQEAAQQWKDVDSTRFPPVANESNDDRIPLPSRHAQSKQSTSH